MGNQRRSGGKRRPQKWWEGETFAPHFREMLRDWQPPWHPYDFDRFCEGFRAAIEALGSPSDLSLAGAPLPSFLADLDGQAALSEPHSPALQAWRGQSDLTLYRAFATRLDDWRAPALRTLQAALLYFTCRPHEGPLSAAFGTSTSLRWLIEEIARPAAYLPFSLAEHFARTPSRTSLAEWAAQTRSIVAAQPPGGRSLDRDCFLVVAATIEDLPKHERGRLIDIGRAEGSGASPAAEAGTSGSPTPWVTLRARLPNSAEALLMSCGIGAPGRLDLALFTNHAREVIALAPAKEKLSAHWVSLNTTLQELERVAADLPLLADDYTHWWCAKGPVPYRSILAMRRVRDGGLRYPIVAGLCLRAALLQPPTEDPAARIWQDAVSTLNRLAHDLYLSSTDIGESRLGRVIECIPNGLSTKASAKKLMKLADLDPGVASDVAALLVVLEAIAKASQVKARATESTSGSAPVDPNDVGKGQLTPSARGFFDRVVSVSLSNSDREGLIRTLTDMLPQAEGHEIGGSATEMLMVVLAALNQATSTVPSESAADPGPSARSPTLDALTLQPVPALQVGIRTLQFILFQHVCAPPRHWPGKGVSTRDLDAPLANLILTIDRMTDPELRAEAGRYLERVPLIPADAESYDRLWKRQEKRALASSDVRTIVDVLRCIQRDRCVASPPKPRTSEALPPRLLPSSDSDTRQTGTKPGQRPRCSSAPRRSGTTTRSSGAAEARTSRVERRCRSTALRVPIRRPTKEELDRARQNGETIEEIVGETEAAITETRPRAMGRAQQRVFAARQVSAMRQGVWARHQWDALTTEESAAFIRWLLAQTQIGWTTTDYVRREAIAVCLMMSITGFSLHRAHAVRMLAPLDSEDDGWDPERSALTFPLPGTDSRFEPTDLQTRSLEVVATRISLMIPREIASVMHRLEAFDDPFLYACDLDQLGKSVSELIEQAREHMPRLSLARIQRSLHLEVLNQLGDIASAQLICGDTLGVAPTPMAYYAARADAIQQGYNKAVQRFGLTPEPPDLYMRGRVGSKLLVTPKALLRFVSHVQRGLVQVPRPARTNGRAAAELHSTLVPSLATLFLAATGHRPTFRIGCMTSTFFCLRGSLAVIEDKISDEQHESRLVPLCPLLRSSLAAYGKHLERLTKNVALIDAHRQAAKDALSGSGPLFFMFDGADTRPLTVDDLNGRAPPDWSLPKNFLRHHLATALRDQDCPGVYVQALLGHLEAGIQPFGSESFMSPPEYLDTTSSQLESMLRADGWRCILGGDEDHEVFARHAPPLARAVLGIQSRHVLASQDQHRKQRRHVELVRAERKGEIDAWIKGLIDAAVSATTKPTDAGPIEINADAVSDIRKQICAAADDLAHAEASIDALRVQLEEGRALGRWKVKRLPSFFVPRPAPAVFKPAFVSLYSSILRLRQMLLSEVVQSPKAEPQDAARRCILALILWHGICDHERLHWMLRGIPRAQCARNIDALVVPVDLVETATGRIKTSSEVLRGVVALLAHAVEDSLRSELDEEKVQSILASWIPRDVIDCPAGDLLGVLFEAVAAAHRFESIGPVREVWTGNYTSVSLPPERLLALLDSAAPRSTEAFQLPMEQPIRMERPSSAEASGQRGALKLGYGWLKDVLRYRPGKTKTFPSFSPDEEQTKSATRRSREEPSSQLERDIRKEIVRRLDERLNRWPEDGSLLRALTAYALDRLQNGTPWKPRVGLRTVYGYVLGAGTPMLAQHDGMPLDQMDSEDYHEIYEACIQGSKYVAPAKMARLLAYFHGFLAAKCGAPGVAIGVSTTGGRCFPDVGYVTPHEYLRAQRLLDDCLASAQAAEGSIAELKAAAVALPLGFATGGRTAEVMLREADELTYDEGQRALLVRRNGFTGVKTLRATRRISIEGTVCDQDWRQIESWRDDVAALRPKGAIAHSALFPEWSSGRPIDPDRLTKLIGETLRCATGLAEARPYWWRHTLSCNELLTQLGGDDVLEALTPVGEAPTLGLGADGEALGYPPAGVPLCQAHAANFRARRGHWRMRTSIETYVHLIALIEPHASRQVSLDLSVDQLGRLAGLSPHAARKRLVRAGTSASHRTGVVRLLLGGGASPATSEPEARPDTTTRSFAREIDLATIISAVVSAVRAGDLALAWRALHMTSAEASRWETALRAAVDANLYGAELPGTSKIASESQRIGVVRRKKKHTLHVQRVNTGWLIDCIDRALRDPQALEAWRVVLRGLDLASGCIAVSSHAELVTLLKVLPLGSKGSEEHPSLNVELVARATDVTDTKHVTVGSGTTTLSAPVKASSRFHPPLGCLTIGAVVKDSGRGRAMSSTLLLAAVLACAACEILGPAQQSPH